jgi:hypothetical protein
MEWERVDELQQADRIATAAIRDSSTISEAGEKIAGNMDKGNLKGNRYQQSNLKGRRTKVDGGGAS